LTEGNLEALAAMLAAGLPITYASLTEAGLVIPEAAKFEHPTLLKT
jgi:hypothetical protein